MNGGSVTSGNRKIAIFMLMLPSDLASQVLKYLSEDEVAPLVAEMMAIGTAPAHERAAVLKEFSKSTGFGGSDRISYYRELLQSTLGQQRADDMLAQLMPKQSAMFDRMRRERRIWDAIFARSSSSSARREPTAQGGIRARDQRALAPHLRGRDHAAAGALHSAVQHRGHAQANV